jgi:hypothetical protein
LLFEPEELIERICSLIPRPQVNLVIYHGVLAPNAKWRRRVIAHARGKLPQAPAPPALASDLYDEPP